ncbi:PAS domain S-box protein, partial [bacterium]|nr:PAS domain S-box protein [bacterium]
MPLDPDQNNTAKKIKNSEHTVQKRLFLPLVCVSILFVAISTLILIYTQKTGLEQFSVQKAENIKYILFHSIEEQSRALAVLQSIILDNTDLRENLQKHDRKALFEKYKDLFERLQKDYDVTHFYFHLPDRKNLVRIHNKSKHGDIIDRFAIREAQRTLKPFASVELCPHGFFTLSVVQPILFNGTIVGFIEFGKKIEDILANIHKEPGIELALNISKYKLDKSTWETGMAIFGKQAQWDRFPKKVLIYSSVPDFPVQWERYVSDNGQDYDKIGTITEYNDKSWHALKTKFSDTSGSEIGVLLIFVDVTEPLSKYKSFTFKTVGTAIIGLILLLWLIFKRLQRTGRMIYKQQKSIEKSEKEFRGLFNSITDLVFTHNMEGEFISVNPAVHKLFGYDMDEFLGHSAADFMPSEFVKDYNFYYLEKIKKRGFCQGISTYYKKNSEKIYIEYKSSLVKPIDREPYISGIGRDVTEKIKSDKKVKELQEQVVQSQKMESIGVLAGGIAHDFNNILFPIMGHTEMLLADFPEDSLTHKSLTKIYSGALRARDLAKQILDFARQDTGKSISMNIYPVINEAIKLVESSIHSNIKVITALDKDISAVKADPTKIHQIVINLITNACYSMGEAGGELKISLKEIELEQSELINLAMHPGVYVRVRISDTGVGMDSEVISKIFDPFFTTKFTGRGLGMAAVLGIIRGHKGAIKIHSVKGKGTTFKVLFPVD